MAKWYVVRGDQERGPFEDAQLKELATSGKLKPDHQIRRDGSTTVRMAKEIKGLFPSKPSITPIPPNQAPSSASPEPQVTTDSMQSKDAGASDSSVAEQWFYVQGENNNQTHGPVTFTKLTALAKRGEVSGKAMIARNGSKWILAESFLAHFLDASSEASDEDQWSLRKKGVDYGTRTFDQLCALAAGGNIDPNYEINRLGGQWVPAAALIEHWHDGSASAARRTSTRNQRTFSVFLHAVMGALIGLLLWPVFGTLLIMLVFGSVLGICADAIAQKTSFKFKFSDSSNNFFVFVAVGLLIVSIATGTHPKWLGYLIPTKLRWIRGNPKDLLKVDKKNIVFALKLDADYRINQAAADSEYKDKTLTIAGNVTGIENSFGEYYIKLEGESKFRNVQCSVGSSSSQALRELKPGDWVRVRGDCAGDFGSVMMRNCIFVKADYLAE